MQDECLDQESAVRKLEGELQDLFFFFAYSVLAVELIGLKRI